MNVYLATVGSGVCVIFLKQIEKSVKLELNRADFRGRDNGVIVRQYNRCDDHYALLKVFRTIDACN